MGTSIMLIQEQKTQSKSTPTLPPAYALAQEHWRHRTELMERQLQLQEAYTLLLPTGEGETAATKFWALKEIIYIHKISTSQQ